ESRGAHLPARAPGVEPRVAGDTPLHNLPECCRKLPRLLGADEAGQGLLEQLVRAKAEQRRHGVVGLEDLALEIGDEYWVGGVLDETLSVGPGLVELAHVAQDADGADHF